MSYTITRIYANGDEINFDYSSSEEVMQDAIYAMTSRPGCAYFIEGTCVQQGYLSGVSAWGYQRYFRPDFKNTHLIPRDLNMKFPTTLAYNMEDKKVGCALIQPLLGASLTGGDVTFHFNTEWWELNPSKCKVYTVATEEEFRQIVALTRKAHANQNEKLAGSSD